MDRFTVNRRQALRTLGHAAAGAAASSLWVESLGAFSLQQVHTPETHAAIAATDWTPAVLTGRQNQTVVILTELIIPETDTPGAKATNVNRFIDRILAVAKREDREAFMRGLAWIDQRSQTLFGGDFSGTGAENQTKLLTRLSTEGNPDKEDQIGLDFFRAIKSMTINGYYSTEIGLRRELGDSGRLFQTVSQGCDHPEHQA
jgi:glucoside 3-dehydrogenase (cytochrome c) hitch-hiker subunit